MIACEELGMDAEAVQAVADQDARADRALFLVVRINPLPDRLAEAEAQLQRMRAASLKEAGCVSMHLVQGVDDDPGTWVMIEHFRSRAAWDDHMGSEHNQRGNEELEPLLREPSSLNLYYEK
jgi:quinol monooxygenase YgiN